jgi:hypothetical protein
MKPNLPDTHDHENTNHLACYSPSPGREGRGEGEQLFAEGAKKSLSLCPLYLLW